MCTGSGGYSGKPGEPRRSWFGGHRTESWRSREHSRWPFPQDQLWAAQQMDYLHPGDSDPENALSARSRVWHAEENLGEGWVAFMPPDDGWGAAGSTARSKEHMLTVLLSIKMEKNLLTKPSLPATGNKESRKLSVDKHSTILTLIWST